MVSRNLDDVTDTSSNIVVLLLASVCVRMVNMASLERMSRALMLVSESYDRCASADTCRGYLLQSPKHMLLTHRWSCRNAGVSPVEELFSVAVALAGLAGFALALALVEQVVLETNMANVKRGSPVYESGHVSPQPVEEL
jgi:hypothetical protein